jgi:alpha-tubulin suppressor-like RCC1 family protein
MKSKPQSTIVIRHSSFTAHGTALLAAIALFVTAPGAPAQNVTISAAQFQSMVYSASLYTQLSLKPELGASLQVLLELQRRNPNADPAALAGLSSNALQLYRATAPYYIRTNGYPDEILSEYLECLRQLPARTNFIPVNLTMLNNFMLNLAEYDYFTNDTVLDLINSSDQRLTSSEGLAIKCQALVDNCVARAQGNPGFASAMESLLWPETQVSLADTAAAIIGNTNSPLHGNLTMQTLLALSAASGDGSLTVSSNQVMNLFTSEMQTFWKIINTNLAVLAQINQSQPDYLAYLANQAAVESNVQFQAAVQQGQPAQIACATAAVLVQSRLLPVGSESVTSKLVTGVSADLEIGIGILGCGLGEANGADSILGGCLDLFNEFGGQQTPEDELATQISNVQTMVGDLSANMNYRFDRVDQSLTTIYSTLNSNFSQIQMTLGAQGQQIATLQGSVDAIRGTLVTVQAGLDRIEAEDFAGFIDQQHQNMDEDIDGDLLYLAQFPGRSPLSESAYEASPLGPEDLFYTYATEFAADSSVSPTNSGFDFTGSGAETQLATYGLDGSLNYIQQFLSTLGLSTWGTEPLANPQEWFIAAFAYLQLSAENPMWFRKDASQRRVSDIISRGQNLTNFCGSLTFIPGTTNINWPLYNALEGYYASNLVSFNGQVSNAEYQYASDNNLALGAWRQWDLAAPRVTATATAVLGAPPSMPSIIIPREPATNIAAGAYDSLALMTDGTVVGWGANDYGQSTIPASLSNVVALAAGGEHSLALETNGTIEGWGDNTYGQTNIPPGLSNVAAIAAGAVHSLALRSNGTVAGWGDNSFGQTNIPAGLSNVVAIAAGADHSLALQADGTVVGWGAGSPGSAGYALSFNGASNVVTVANQSVLNLYPLTISAWIKTTQTNNGYGSGIINKFVSDSGNGYQLFLYSGHIHAWYFQSPSAYIYNGGQQGMDGGLVADGRWHQVAFVVDVNGGRIFVDGTLTASLPWTGTPGPTTTSQPLTLGYYHGGSANEYYSGLLDDVRIWNVARSQAQIQADMMHRLTGTEPNLIAYWKLDDGTGATATNSAVATGSACNGALAGPTWVPGWAGFGQATIPSGLSNVMAIAAGAWHSLALQSNGTVVAWGLDDRGQCDWPPGLSNVAAIAAGDYHSLALQADGTVVGWGDNTYGQTNIPFGLSNVVAIAAGADHSLALKGDGTVVAWGRIHERQCLVPPAVTWRGAIAAGDLFNLALTAEGTVLGWGAGGGEWGVPDEGDNDLGETNVPTGLSNVVAIAAGYEDSLALQADGTVVAWGDNGWGETGTIPAGLSNAVAIAAGYDDCLALTADGTVVGWGENDYGEAAPPTGLSNVVAIAAGWFYSLALTAEGTVVAWGDNSYGQTNIPAGLSNVVAIAAGEYHSLALTADGTVVGWGDDEYGETTIPPGLTSVVAIAAGYDDSLALTADGTVVGWGENYNGATTIPSGLSNVVAIAAGTDYSLALKADGTIVGWGITAPSSTPSGLSNAVAIAAGYEDSLALTAEGTVVDWGDNSCGQTNIPAGLSNVVAIAAGGDYYGDYSLVLTTNGTVVGWGDNTYGQTNIPFGLSNVVAIAAGAWHSLALQADGTVVGWGYDADGETTIPSGLSRVVAIAAGDGDSLALQADGTVVGWGFNYCGEATGVPTTTSPFDNSGPVVIGGQVLSGVVAIAAGDVHSLALKADGTVVGWGDNEFGQATIPAGLSNVVAIAAGSYHSLALKADGTVVGWGDNEYGETTIPAGLSNVVAIAAGKGYSLFLTATLASGSAASGGLSFVEAEIPAGLGALFYSCNTNTIYQMGLAGPLNSNAMSLSGAKALLAAVLQLGMPYTLERDGVLHGFLYGSQSLMDTSAATAFLQTQNAQFQATPNAPLQLLGDEARLRFQCFCAELNTCLTNLQATGQPEIPRLVGHTLRLLDLLSDAWTPPANSPPPALELSSQSNSPCLLLYGEPYMYYTLQYCDTLSGPGWTTTITNVQDEQTITPPYSGSSHRFYRTVLPMP